MTASDFSQGAADLRWVVARFRGILAAADSMEKLGGLQQGLFETQKQLEAAQLKNAGEQALTEQILARRKDALDAIQKEHDELIARKTADIDKQLADAATEAERIKTAAAAVALETLDAARERAKNIDNNLVGKRNLLDKATKDVEAMMATHSELAAKIETLKSEHSGLMNVISSIQERLAIK